MVTGEGNLIIDCVSWLKIIDATVYDIFIIRNMIIYDNTNSAAIVNKIFGM